MALTKVSPNQLQSSRSPFSSDAEAGAAGYAGRSLLVIKTGETIVLECDPSSGDDIQDMADWISAKGHFIEEGGELYMEVADGLHSVTTYIDITNQGFLDIRATAAPDFIDVESATFSGTSGDITATITVASGTLPTRVDTGFVVGGLNIQGDGGADILNCGMTCVSRLSSSQFTAELHSQGTNLAAFTTPTTGYNTDPSLGNPDLGVGNNRLIVPKATIIANEAGWDGAAREGFVNAERGGILNTKWLGWAFEPTPSTGDDDNDMFFSRDPGSEIFFRDYSVIAGAGEMTLRSFNQGNITLNRCCVGGNQSGINIWQGSAGGSLSVTRSFMGSVSGDAISCSLSGKVQIGLSVIAGGNNLVRTTYPDSTVSITKSRLSRGGGGAVPTKGDITVDSNSSIQNCTTPISITGSNSGRVHGAPAIQNNTNATVTAYAIQSSGGVWLQSSTKPFDSSFYPIDRFSAALDFPSISANSYEDLTLTATGAAFNDFCLFQRSGSTEPAQGIVFRAFVSDADEVTVRAYNVTTGAINPTAFTALVLVIRAT